MSRGNSHLLLELYFFRHAEVLLTAVLLEEFLEVGVFPMLSTFLMLFLQHGDLCRHTHRVYLS